MGTWHVLTKTRGQRPLPPPPPLSKRLGSLRLQHGLLSVLNLHSVKHPERERERERITPTQFCETRLLLQHISSTSWSHCGSFCVKRNHVGRRSGSACDWSRAFDFQHLCEEGMYLCMYETAILPHCEVVLFLSLLFFFVLPFVIRFPFCS